MPSHGALGNDPVGGGSPVGRSCGGAAPEGGTALGRRRRADGLRRYHGLRRSRGAGAPMGDMGGGGGPPMGGGETMGLGGGTPMGGVCHLGGGDPGLKTCTTPPFALGDAAGTSRNGWPKILTSRFRKLHDGRLMPLPSTAAHAMSRTPPAGEAAALSPCDRGVIS